MRNLKSILLCSILVLVTVVPVTSHGPANHGLPDSGQVICYDENKVIPCPKSHAGPLPDSFPELEVYLGSFHGQDGQYSILPPSYTDNGDGTVTDNVTGLMWMRCPAGTEGTFCEKGEPQRENWAKALSFCSRLSLAGYNDWRLPNVRELASIVSYGRYDPAIDTTHFPSCPSERAWTGTTFETNARNAWFVHFGFGYVGTGEKAEGRIVRAVRGGGR